MTPDIQEWLNNNYNTPLDTSHQFLPDAETYFIQEYHNNKALIHILSQFNVSFVRGRYQDMRDLRKYKAMIALPDASCKIGYMETIQNEIPLLLPSKHFLSTLIQLPWYSFTSKQYVHPTQLPLHEFVEYSQYYDYPTCYIFFDSFEHLIDITRVSQTPFETCMLNMKMLKDIIYDDIIDKWKKVLQTLE